MAMVLVSTMGGGAGDMSAVLPLLFATDEDNEEDLVLLMVLLSSMSGGMSSQRGFDNSFNMLLPFLLLSFSCTTDTCRPAS